MRGLLWHLLDLPEWEAMCLLALLPLLEASTLLGVLVPGETALVLGGVRSRRRRMPVLHA